MTTSSPNADQAGPVPAFDGHVDLLYALRNAGPGRAFAELVDGPITPESLAAGHVRLFASALYCSDQFNGPSAVLHLRQLHQDLTRRLAALPVIRNRTQLEQCWQGKPSPAQLLLLENADALAEMGPEQLVEWGILTVGLTHAGPNRLADGNAATAPGGLTARGWDVVKGLARQGRVIDLAHLAEPGFWQVLDCYDGPLCSSHTGLRRFCDTPRNLSDAQVTALLARGGLIGLSFAPEMLVPSGRADLDTVFTQLDSLVQSHGPHGIALGSDFGGFDTPCTGLEDHGQLPVLADRLRQAGYAETAIARIFGGNWFAFYRQVLPNEAGRP